MDWLLAMLPLRVIIALIGASIAILGMFFYFVGLHRIGTHGVYIGLSWITWGQVLTGAGMLLVFIPLSSLISSAPLRWVVYAFTVIAVMTLVYRMKHGALVAESDGHWQLN